MRYIPISVSKKILADISSGIYRTPANALKELVSNAFDASAHKVIISTNAPYFDVFTCEDDGEGITAKEFEEVLKIIGSSTKRAGGIHFKKGRPIIGKIGIGLLAVAQICHKFTVISKKAREKTYFEATIDLKQFEEVEKDTSYWDGSGKISLGKCQIEDGLKDEVGPKRHYTKIIMEDLKEGFRNKLLEEEPKRIFKITEKAVKSENLIMFIDSIKKKNFNELSQYDQLIWELGILCPVEYIDDGPLPDNTILQSEIEKLKKYNFKVFVDGFGIRKPIMFPTEVELKEKGVDYRIYPYISFNKKIDNSKLSFTGYLFHQRKKIQPAELQGILIRIKGVAIGSYDRTFLHYPKAEGPMFNQLSGEIFVEEGIEEALNIDRNSFNETHPHYLKLQEFLWNYLGGKKGVFKDIRKRSKERRDIFHSKESEKELLKVREIIKTLFEVDISLQRIKKENTEPYYYNRKEKKLMFYSHPFWTKNRRQRLIREKLVLEIVAAKEISTSIDSFEKNLIRLFSR
jgi:hypothetical protein